MSLSTPWTVLSFSSHRTCAQSRPDKAGGFRSLSKSHSLSTKASAQCHCPSSFGGLPKHLVDHRIYGTASRHAAATPSSHHQRKYLCTSRNLQLTPTLLTLRKLHPRFFLPQATQQSCLTPQSNRSTNARSALRKSVETPSRPHVLEGPSHCVPNASTTSSSLCSKKLSNMNMRILSSLVQ